MNATKHDYLAVGCFGWARAKTARKAFSLCKLNALPSLIKPGYRNVTIWKLADEVDRTVVSGDGTWYVKSTVADVELPEVFCKEVWKGKISTVASKIPETFE
jgi:hypothetical protein